MEFASAVWQAFAQHREAQRTHKPTLIVWRRLPGLTSQDVFEYPRSPEEQAERESQQRHFGAITLMLGHCLADRWTVDYLTEEEIESMWLGTWGRR